MMKTRKDGTIASTAIKMSVQSEPTRGILALSGIKRPADKMIRHSTTNAQRADGHLADLIHSSGTRSDCILVPTRKRRQLQQLSRRKGRMIK